MEQTSTPTQETKKRTRWYQRTPSVKRFILWNLFCWAFGISALVGGILYTEHIVRPVAEAGGTNFNPINLLEKKESGKRVFGNKDRLNILVVGIDYNYNDKGILYTKGARSDTIIVLSLSRDAEFLNVVSIPRDTQVLIAEDIGYGKVNSAYSYGGIEQAKETVSNFLGIPIHHHVILKVSGAKDVVDALGGLPIDVEKDMDYDDNWGKLHIHLKEGPQVLDGEQAVGYARFRMDEEGDRGRIRRQQQVIRALGRKLKEPAIVTRLQDLAKVVSESVDTDLKYVEMADLANLYIDYDFSKMRGASIVGDDAVDPNGISYIVPYEPENRRTVRRLLQDLDWLRKDDLRIRIYFKKAPSYIAYNLADRLYDAGFRGVQVEALAWENPVDTDETRLVWYNEVPRLKGVLQAVVGTTPSSTEHVPEGKDDDLAIYLGDDEEGGWEKVPDTLLQERESEALVDPYEETDRNTRYQPEFIPRSLPPAEENFDEPYESEWEEEEPETFQESITPDYPTRDEVGTEPPAPRREPAPVVEESQAPAAPAPPPPPPQPVEIPLGEPLPVATPVAPIE